MKVMERERKKCKYLSNYSIAASECVFSIACNTLTQHTTLLKFGVREHVRERQPGRRMSVQKIPLTFWRNELKVSQSRM